MAAVPPVRPDDAAIWREYLALLWLSGLRLDEVHRLSFDVSAPFRLTSNDAGRWFISIGSHAEKRRDRVIPTMPDFDAWITATWGPRRLRGRLCPVDVGPNEASRIVGAISFAAGVFVNDVVRPRRRKGLAASETPSHPKPATPQDFRRSFAQRWSFVLTVDQLQEVMLHGSIETTRKYYL